MIKIRAFFRNLFRALAFAKVGWNNYDFDYGYIEDLVLFKLKRIEKEMTGGYTDWSVPAQARSLKALRLAIKLFDKLQQTDNSMLMDQHESKWGKLIVETEESDRPGQYKLITSRPHAATPRLREIERKEFLEASYADDRREQRHRRIAYQLMAKYSTDWWD